MGAFLTCNTTTVLPLADSIKLAISMTSSTIDAWYHCKLIAAPIIILPIRACQIQCMLRWSQASNTCKGKINYFWASIKFKVSTYSKIWGRHNFMQDSILHSWSRSIKATACASRCVSIWILGVHSEEYNKSRSSNRLICFSTGYNHCILRPFATRAFDIAAVLMWDQASSLSLGHCLLSSVELKVVNHFWQW